MCIFLMFKCDRCGGYYPANEKCGHRRRDSKMSEADTGERAIERVDMQTGEVRSNLWPRVVFDPPVDLSTNAIDGSKWGLNILADPIAYTNRATEVLRKQVETLAARVTALEQEQMKTSGYLAFVAESQGHTSSSSLQYQTDKVQWVIDISGMADSNPSGISVYQPCPCGGLGATRATGPQHLTTCSLWEAG